MNFKMKTVLILAPHTDDGEFGCGGTIVRLIREGANVHYIAFSSCRASVPKGLPDDILKDEVKRATSVLGIKAENLYLFDFPVRQFSQFRQEILEELVIFEKKLKPDFVFMPSPNDIHQDHHTISLEGIRAFKQKTILAYEMPANHLVFSTQAFIRLKQEDVDNKLLALKEYKSQLTRPYANEEYIRGLAKIRGVSVGVDYAEAFEVIRLHL